jgi:hypothetical protein
MPLAYKEREQLDHRVAMSWWATASMAMLFMLFIIGSSCNETQRRLNRVVENCPKHANLETTLFYAGCTLVGGTEK